MRAAGGGLGTSILLCWGLALATLGSPRPAPSGEPKAFKIDRFQWTADPSLVAGIRRIELRNDYGDVRARVGLQEMIEVHSVLQRLGTGPDDVGVNVVRHEEVLAITVTYPPGRADTAKPRLAKDEIDRCDLVVYLPPGVDLSAQSMRGIIEARHLAGNVSASTLDGEIRVSATGTIRARSRDGSMTVVFSKDGVRSGASLLESETGTMSVTVPSGSDLDIRAQTAGKITGNLPSPVESEAGVHRLGFRSGLGSHSLWIRSGSGDVEFYQAQP